MNFFKIKRSRKKYCFSSNYYQLKIPRQPPPKKVLHTQIQPPLHRVINKQTITNTDRTRSTRRETKKKLEKIKQNSNIQNEIIDPLHGKQGRKKKNDLPQKWSNLMGRRSRGRWNEGGDESKRIAAGTMAGNGEEGLGGKRSRVSSDFGDFKEQPIRVGGESVQ